jgi:hypothetical protein
MMQIGIEILVMMGVLVGLAAWRIGRIVSWRALARTALATGSFATCVAYIRYCEHQRRS